MFLPRRYRSFHRLQNDTLECLLSEKAGMAAYLQELLAVLQEEEVHPEYGNPYLREELRAKVDCILAAFHQANLSEKDINQLTAAATAGDADAQFKFHELSMEGIGVEQNYAVGLEWARKSASQGKTLGELNLGRFMRMTLELRKTGMKL